jgi:hypothetical protein
MHHRTHRDSQLRLSGRRSASLQALQKVAARKPLHQQMEAIFACMRAPQARHIGRAAHGQQWKVSAVGQQCDSKPLHAVQRMSAIRYGPYLTPEH